MKSRFDSRRTIVAIVLGVLAGAMLLWAIWRWYWPLSDLISNQDRLRDWVRGLGPWGPVVSIGLNTAQVIVAPIPGQFVGVMNGYLYGLWLGTFYSMIGLLIGTALAMGLARKLGRPFVERLVKPGLLARWDRLTEHQGPWFFFLVYLIPGLPDDLICFVIGLSRLPIGHMIALAMVGRLPGVFVSCWVGAYAADIPLWMWIPLSIGAGAIAWLLWRYRTPIEHALVRFIQRLVHMRGGPSLARPHSEMHSHSTPPQENRPDAE
ncbi:MAG: TVP38/TMEM64 family protein [Chloroflexi bacterium]|nr:TVP38/TMEM64 family protein [Chloroflexota bacterium]